MKLFFNTQWSFWWKQQILWRLWSEILEISFNSGWLFNALNSIIKHLKCHDKFLKFFKLSLEPKFLFCLAYDQFMSKPELGNLTDESTMIELKWDKLLAVFHSTPETINYSKTTWFINRSDVNILKIIQFHFSSSILINYSKAIKLFDLRRISWDNNFNQNISICFIMLIFLN